MKKRNHTESQLKTGRCMEYKSRSGKQLYTEIAQNHYLNICKRNKQ